MPIQLPEALQKKIDSLGTEVSPAEIDLVERVHALQNRRLKLQLVLTEWGKQQDSDRRLRERYALVILIALGAQVLLASAVLFLVGFKAMELSDWVASVFFTAVFTEVVAMTYVVLRHLFRPTAAPAIDLKEVG
jgi:hypothetical protein